MKQQQIIFIVGPTGVGKSAVALELALLLKGEIVSCDAMQVYKESVIASDRPSDKDFGLVAHHMIGCVSVVEDFDVARYRQEALTAMNDIWARVKMPIVVGGSGMYAMVLLDGIFEGGKEEPMIRRQLKEDVQVQGLAKVYQRLKKVDPEAADNINPNDERRIIRALEVYMTTRKPITKLQKERQGLWGRYDIRIFALNRDRAQLYDRVNQRVEEMFARGLIDEVKQLNALPLGRTAKSLIGIPEVNSYLDGTLDLDKTKELMKMNTRHYVKRQLTWFRRDGRMEWITIKDESPQETAGRILENLKERKS